MKSAIKRSLIALAGALLLANCASQPTQEIDLTKAKASLRLADGSTISQPNSEEYNPYLINMDDNYLVLVFGSNREGCGIPPCYHNIFVTRSLTPYDGVNLPLFDAPQPVMVGSSPLNEINEISFAVKKQGTGVRIFLNRLNEIQQGDVSYFVNPTTSLTTILNVERKADTVIGISADGNLLYSTNGSGAGYAFNPDNAGGFTLFGAEMDYVASAAPVRQENSGSANSIYAVSYGSTLALAGGQYVGSLIALDLSLLSNGLEMSKISTFLANDPGDDLVLFSAVDLLDGDSDLYVVTSHTAKELWDTAVDFAP